MPKTTKKKDYIFAVGRRKRAIARVRLYTGRGDNLVNGKLLADYFPGASFTSAIMLPFLATKSQDKHWISAKIVGGGKKGQVDALVHGIARTLVALNETNKPTLKKLGLMTRDSRKKQRRHVGTGGKARRQKSSPKR